jgi:inhibitor of KinA
MNPLRIYPISETAVTIETGTGPDLELHRRIISLWRRLCENPFPGLMESVPCTCSLTVFFDPKVVRLYLPQGMTSSAQYVSKILEQAYHQSPAALEKEKDVITIPVCYDQELGPDLQSVSEICRITMEELIRRHTTPVYRVFMIGFAPGFPYMGIIDPVLEMPRKERPTLSVPAGAVAIAGKMTGIYPFSMPGGWHVIGRTPLRLFDKNKKPSTLLQAGDLARFRPIDMDTFQKLVADEPADH